MMKIYHISLFLSLAIGLMALVEACTSAHARHEESVKPVADPQFEKKVVFDEFISEGVALADVNRDGQKDILAGHYWFEAPDWKKHEIREPETFDYTKGYSHSFLNFTADVDQDGWIDFICFDFPGDGVYWYRNPQGEDKHWQEFVIDTMACNESPMMADLDGDGREELVYGNEVSGTMMRATMPPTPGDLTWDVRPLSKADVPGTGRFSHGLGFGDVNLDGRGDVMIREGWFEAPVNYDDLWTFHPTNLGEPCSQMYAYDFDGDGDQDIISASAHAYGIWWHEQIGIDGRIAFTRHLIDSTFSQTHGVAFIDMNGDDQPDLVTGKRFYAHQGKDPGGKEAPVIYWIELTHDAQGNPTWVKHLIDDDSGVGLQVIVEDMNGDGKLDILNANKKGVIAFLGK